MARNLFDFGDEKIENEKKTILNNINEETLKESLEETVDKFKSLSTSELENELFSRVERAKEDNSFDFERMKEMSKNISPYLSSEQLDKLNSLFERMK